MKRSLLKLSTLLIFFSFFLSQSYSQIPNGDFSNWALDSLGRMDLVGWTTTNQMYDSPGAMPDTDRVNGPGYSLKMVTVYDSTVSDYTLTLLTLEHAPFSNTINPSTLTGFWTLYDPFFTDILSVDVTVYDSNNIELGDGGINTPFTGSILNWTAFTVNINYTVTAAVDNYTVNIMFGNLSNQPGIYSHVDDITFDVSTTINETRNELKTKLLSLENSKFRILLSQDLKNDVDLSIYDVSGRKLAMVEGNSDVRQSIDVDLSAYPSGIYYGVVENGNQRQTIKLANSK